MSPGHLKLARRWLTLAGALSSLAGVLLGMTIGAGGHPFYSILTGVAWSAPIGFSLTLWYEWRRHGLDDRSVRRLFVRSGVFHVFVALMGVATFFETVETTRLRVLLRSLPSEHVLKIEVTEVLDDQRDSTPVVITERDPLQRIATCLAGSVPCVLWRGQRLGTTRRYRLRLDLATRELLLNAFARQGFEGGLIVERVTPSYPRDSGCAFARGLEELIERETQTEPGTIERQK